MFDRALDLPVRWTDNQQRCAEAGIGDDVEFATKPELAQRMLHRLLNAHSDIGWFTADEAYGDDPGYGSLLLVRRSISKPSELAYYICDTNTPVPVSELVRVAGSVGVSRKPSSSP